MSRSVRVRAWLPIVAAASLLAGCGSSWDAPESCEGEAWFESQIFFGHNMPGGGEINEVLWRDFVEGVVAPRFRNGFTVLESTGFWMPEGSAQTEREQGKVLIVLYRDEERGSKAVQEVAQSYAARFNQEAVLRADRRACVTFHRGAATTQQ